MTASTPSRRTDSNNLDLSPPRTEQRTPSFLRSASRRRTHISPPSPAWDPNPLTPSRRLVAPDLRGSLLRRYTTTQVDSFSPRRDDTSGQYSDILSSPLRRTKSLVEPNRQQQQQQQSSSSPITEVQWTHEDWLCLSRYYESLGRDIKKTINVFYRHESLQTSPSTSGSRDIEEKWSESFIAWRVHCLDVVRKRHGDSFENRVEAYQAQKRKREQSSLESATNTSKNIINLDDEDDEEEQQQQQRTPKRRRREFPTSSSSKLRAS